MRGDGDSAQDLLIEVRGHVAWLREGVYEWLADLNVLFLPTGDLGEVAFSSGWSQQYLELAARFEDAYVRIRAQMPRE